MRRVTFRERLRGLLGDRRGITATEFALITPPLLFLLMGGCEMVYQVYVQSIFDGAMQRAGRDSSIQGSAQKGSDLDAYVLNQIKTVARDATIQSTERLHYSTFSDMKPEAFEDKNKNGRRDAKECFDDTNGNGSWDADPSRTGQGGADDVVMYTLRITYPRLFPVGGLLGWEDNPTLSARTLLKNQPYASQNLVAVKSICT